jgi:NADPH:quinone reductase-like Zn-dependent oxidoreductase
VGSFAVQLAKWKGAHVWSTASSANQQLLRDLGTARPIDYTHERFEDVAHDMDIVFDTVGGEVQQRSWTCLRPGGTLVSIVSPPSDDEAKAHGAKAAYVFVQPHAQQLAELARLIDNGTIKPVIAQVFPLAEARRAHELSQSGHARGKIVLKVH